MNNLTEFSTHIFERLLTYWIPVSTSAWVLVVRVAGSVAQLLRTANRLSKQWLTYWWLTLGGVFRVLAKWLLVRILHNSCWKVCPINLEFLLEIWTTWRRVPNLGLWKWFNFNWCWFSPYSQTVSWLCHFVRKESRFNEKKNLIHVQHFCFVH